MADQDVANDRQVTTTPTVDPIQNQNGSVATPGELLRNEFTPRVNEARLKFFKTIEAMQIAAKAMHADGRPPSYRLLHALGDCHREFLRLRSDLTGGALALSMPLPTLDTLVGLNDLIRLFGPLPLPVEPLDNAEPPPSEAEPPEPDDALEPVPAEPVVVIEASPPVDLPRETTPLDLDPPAAEPEPAATIAVEESEPDDTPEPVPVEPAIVIEASPPVDLPRETTPVELDIPAAEPVADLPEPAVTIAVEEPESPGETVRRSALSVLDEVARLRVRDGSEFPPLNECRTLALAVRERVAASPPGELPAEAVELAEGRHVLAGLLTVVAGTGTLSDAQWADLHARVSETFGRPLAIAAARGRLKVAPPE